ncbi:unnamed protein product [Candidula unifasciata]|uniref:Ig-like domain-containing protein n=1 Tax=Candidula unifasciata TaxID=100452 RepID=A0A8S3ZJT2_9EUPU|nr:unnamed protein product [Candidula unifasciata]
MAKEYFLFTSFEILLLVQTLAFDGIISIGRDTTLGKTGSVSCSYVTAPSEQVLEFFIKPLPLSPGNASDYYYQIPKLGLPTSGSACHNRLSIHVNTSGTPGVTSATMTGTMTISTIRCEDEGRYMCEFSYIARGQMQNNFQTSLPLEVKVLPKFPKLTIETESVHPAQIELWVYEGTKVVAKCCANLGRPGFGSFEWRLYRGEDIEYIDESDKRVSVLQQVPLEPGEPLCSERLEQTFEMQVFRKDQHLVIACFAHNAHFPRASPWVYCEDPAHDMCNQSVQINVIRVYNDEDGYKTQLTYLCIFIAGMFTIVVVKLGALLRRPRKKGLRRKVTKAQTPLIATPPKNEVNNFEETETIIDEEIESRISSLSTSVDA